MAKRVRSQTVEKVKPGIFKARVFRIVGRGIPPLSLEGSVAYGGRYNPPYRFGALYCGLSEEICWSEIQKTLEGSVNRRRFAVVSISVHLHKILDLTDEKVLRQLKIESKFLIHPIDYNLTRRIAAAAREAGFEGILAPSARGPGRILAIFSDGLDRKSRISIVKKRR